jgi:hypothetical protein
LHGILLLLDQTAPDGRYTVFPNPNPDP